MKHTTRLLALSAAIACVVPAWCRQYGIDSPGNRLHAVVNVDDSITIALSDKTGEIMAPSTIGVQWLDEKKLNAPFVVKKTRKGATLDTIASPFYKKSQVTDHYNHLTLTASNGMALEVRLYDDALAYRFVNTARGKHKLANEIATYRLADNYNAWMPYVRDRKKRKNATIEQQFWNDMQNRYTYAPLQSFNASNMVFTPVLVDLPANRKLCIVEADVERYPGMYLISDSLTPTLRGVFAPLPKAVVQGGHNNFEHLVTERHDYIAEIDGARPLPWRAFVVTDRDGALTECDIVYRLASPSRVKDVDWIKPGKVAWEWWNDWGLYDVDFVAGVNNATYRHYIDFAAEHGIEYVILDEGWAVKDRNDMFAVVPEIDIKELVDYGASKGVGIILWAGYLQMKLNLEAVVSHYSALGVKGFKIDFLNRDDQDMSAFMWDAAEVCARHNMMIDYHGCCKPSGLQRTYPNVINYEAVFGLEQLKWSKPDVDMVSYDVTLPFIRMVAGPMDYTQGAMRNCARGMYYPCRANPMSQGTRCHQLAEYVVFESPLNMLCDSPGNYRREPVSIDFIAAVPTVWDETRVLDAKVGEYIVIARRKGDSWFVGALGDWTPRTLTITLPDECLGRQLEVIADGKNAHKIATDHRKSVVTVDNTKQTINLAPGGGWVARTID